MIPCQALITNTSQDKFLETARAVLLFLTAVLP